MLKTVSKDILIKKTEKIDKHDQLFGSVTALIDDVATLLILKNTDINKWVDLDDVYIPAKEYKNYLLGKGELTASVTITKTDCGGYKHHSNLVYDCKC